MTAFDVACSLPPRFIMVLCISRPIACQQRFFLLVLQLPIRELRVPGVVVSASSRPTWFNKMRSDIVREHSPTNVPRGPLSRLATTTFAQIQSQVPKTRLFISFVFPIRGYDGCAYRPGVSLVIVHRSVRVTSSFFSAADSTETMRPPEEWDEEIVAGDPMM
jgi:hypothetical protein